MEQQSFNSTRLSLAIGDLPLTPFGMKSPFEKNKKSAYTTNYRHELIEDRHKCHGLTKLSSHRSLYSPKCFNNSHSSPQIITETISGKFLNVNKMRRKVVGNKTTSCSEETLSENIINIVPATSIPEELCNEIQIRNESYLTDIDDGSFVEFNEATGLLKDKVVRNEMNSYYTCLSQNETKFSTSSKLPNTEVAFRKFMDKAASTACLTQITEGEIFVDKQTKEILSDESVIIVNKNIILENSPKPVIMNSTLKPFGKKASEELPDLSSLTLEELHSSSVVDNVKDAKVLSPVIQRNDQIYNNHISSKVIFCKQTSPQSLISEDVSFSSLHDSVTSSQRFAICPTNYEAKKVERNKINNQTSKFIKLNHENLETEPAKDNGRIKEWILTSPFKSSPNQSHFLNDPLLSHDKKSQEENYAFNISQDLQLQLSLETVADSKEFVPNPNGTVITIAKVARSSKESTPGTVTDARVGIPGVSSPLSDISNNPNALKRNNYSSLSGNLRSPKSVARETCNMREIISLDSEDEESLIYSSDEENVTSAIVSRRISLSTPNLRNWERGKISNKYADFKADSNVPSVSKLCIRNKNEGTLTNAKDQSAYCGYLNRENFESNSYINRNSNSSSNGNVSDVHLCDNKFLKNKIRKSSSFGTNKLKNDFLFNSKKISDDSIPSFDKFTQKSYRDETIVISDLSSCSLSSEEDETPCKNKSGLSNNFKDNKLSERCNIISDKTRFACDVIHRKKNRRIKVPVFKLSSDSDDDPVNYNLAMQNSGHLVDKLTSSTSDPELMTNRLKPKLNNQTPIKNRKDKYLSSDSDFDAYINQWKKRSANMDPVNKKNNSRKPTGSSFLVDSDNSSDSGEDIEFYLQHNNKPPPSNYLSTKQKEVNICPDNLQNLLDTEAHDINNLEKETHASKNLTTLQLLSSDSEWENQVSIFTSKKKPKKDKIKSAIAAQKLVDNTLNTSTEPHHKINRPLSFLASFSLEAPFTDAHPDSLRYLKNFKKNKETMATYLYDYFNKHIFDSKLPKTMKITWNVRLTKTAGLCCYQIDKSSKEGKTARIEMSVKVCDGPARLRDTLIHELCHAACWIISGYKGNHGKIWKAWASKAMRAFPELPIIDRCHNYEIKCKYTYRCIKCGHSFGRHSKSLDLERKVCGLCRGKFELIVNYAKKSENSTAEVPKTPNVFALFVKENYSVVKKKHCGLKHGDVMKQLSEQFKSLKTN